MTQDAIDLDEMLVVTHLDPRAPGESLRAAIDRLISWHISVQLDPQVSSAAAALVERGRAEERARLDDLISRQTGHSLETLEYLDNIRQRGA
jgi:hypothetical protein